MSITAGNHMTDCNFDWTVMASQNFGLYAGGKQEYKHDT